LAPAIADFILDENRECCSNEILQTLILLQSEWNKEIEPSRQSSTHYPLIASKPIDKKDSEFMRRSMQWEAPRCQRLHMTLASFVSKKRY